MWAGQAQRPPLLGAFQMRIAVDSADRRSPMAAAAPSPVRLADALPDTSTAETHVLSRRRFVNDGCQFGLISAAAALCTRPYPQQLPLARGARRAAKIGRSIAVYRYPCGRSLSCGSFLRRRGLPIACKGVRRRGSERARLRPE